LLIPFRTGITANAPLYSSSTLKSRGGGRVEEEWGGNKRNLSKYPLVSYAHLLRKINTFL
jgi:hypothetical protein